MEWAMRSVEEEDEEIREKKHPTETTTATNLEVEYNSHNQKRHHHNSIHHHHHEQTLNTSSEDPAAVADEQYPDPWTAAVVTADGVGGLAEEDEEEENLDTYMTSPEGEGEIVTSVGNGGTVSPVEEKIFDMENDAAQTNSDDQHDQPVSLSPSTALKDQPYDDIPSVQFPPIYSPLSDTEKVGRGEASDDNHRKHGEDELGDGEIGVLAVAPKTTMKKENGNLLDESVTAISEKDLESATKVEVKPEDEEQKINISPVADQEKKSMVSMASSPAKQTTMKDASHAHTPSPPRVTKVKLSPSTTPLSHHRSSPTITGGFSPASPSDRHRSVSFGGTLPHFPPSPGGRYRSPSLGEPYNSGSFSLSPSQQRHRAMSMATPPSSPRHNSLYFGSLSHDLMIGGLPSEGQHKKEEDKPTKSKAEMMLEEKVMSGDTSVAAPTALAMLGQINEESETSKRRLLQGRKERSNSFKKLEKEEKDKQRKEDSIKQKEDGDDAATTESQKEISHPVAEESIPDTTKKSKEEEPPLSPPEKIEPSKTSDEGSTKPALPVDEEKHDADQQTTTAQDSSITKTDDDLEIERKRSSEERKKKKKKKKKKKNEKKRSVGPYVRIPDKRHVHNHVLVASIEEDASIHKRPSITGATTNGGNSANEELLPEQQQLGKNINDQEVNEVMRALSLPHNQYEVVLRRRAVRKKVPGTASAQQQRQPIPQTIKSGSEMQHKNANTNEKNNQNESGQNPKHQPSWRNLFAQSKSSEEMMESAKEAADKKAAKTLDTEHYDEEIEGDVSLGMKLTVIGGRVIIQSLIPLADGRASPAQLAGRIERGDVLLSIDGNSIVHLPVDKFSEGLKPLSSPTVQTSQFGVEPLYKRELRLRFGIGEGLQVLTKYERQVATASSAAADSKAGGASSLSHLVDQHSGMPFFKEEKEDSNTTLPVAKVVPVVDVDRKDNTMHFTPTLQPPAGLDGILLHKMKSIIFHQQISCQVALEKQRERLRYTSGFYNMDTRFSTLLHTTAILHIKHVDKVEKRMTHSELIERGRRALKGAKWICALIEANDRDKRRGGGNRDAISIASIGRGGCSISTWHSRASKRRRQAENPAESSDESEGDDGSCSSGELGENDTGEMLLVQLAAHDVLWQKELVTCLEDMAIDILQGEDKEESQPPQRVVQTPKEAFQSEEDRAKEIENIFFGRQVSKMLSKKKTRALPSEDITSLLYDLSTRITMFISPSGGSGAPLEIHAPVGSPIPPRNSQDMALSFRFVFDEVLPLWLKTFLPVPWKQRHALWPLAQASSLVSDQHSFAQPSSRYDDGMSMSLTTASLSWGAPQPSKKKLAEQIQELELDPHVRADTCYLLTLYFTHKLIPGMKRTKRNQRIVSTNPLPEAEIVEFIKTYGAYLNLYACLVSAADANADVVTKTLLEMAKYDPQHRQAMKELSRANALHLYEPALLSALLESLPLFCRADKQHQQDAISLLVTAYPALRPWQVKSLTQADASNRNGLVKREQVLQANEQRRAIESAGPHPNNSKFYYSYLSLLLHSEEGHDHARRDAALVQEWCILSASNINGAVSPERLRNFCAVASKENQTWILYHRDLPMLLNLSMQISDYNVATELAGEIITDPLHFTNEKVLTETLSHLRVIARTSLECLDESYSLDSSFTQQFDTTLLRRIILIFHMMATSRSNVCRQLINVSEELSLLLGDCSETRDEATVIPSEKEEAFISLVAETAAPSDVLLTLNRWKKSAQASSIVIPSLHTSLTWGARGGLKNELSGALLRIRRAREEGNNVALEEMRFGWDVGEKGLNQNKLSGGIWQSVLRGDLQIDK